MTMVRVTKIICPSCEGTGQFRGMNIPCMWCRGETRVSVEVARQHADHIWMLAGGGFIAGDHDFDHKVAMEQKAEAIYDLTGATPPWKERR